MAAIESVAVKIPRARLQAAAERLSNRYREGTDEVYVRNPEDAAAYVVYRMPATYAATAAAMRYAEASVQGFAPRTVLDVGAGPGTGAWAALHVWPAVERIVLLERDPDMIRVGRELAEASPDVSRAAQWANEDVRSYRREAPFDLVVLSYALGELPVSERQDVLGSLWAMTSGMLLIIEPGTPRGYQAMIDGRDQIIASGARVAAPCPGNVPCPMRGRDWCHFSERLQRATGQRIAKRGSLSYEDEKYSYAALVSPNSEATSRRIDASPTHARIVRHPQIRSGHIYLELCTPDGLTNPVIGKRDKDAFRAARHARWGDAFDRR